MRNVEEIVRAMTLAEKASLCSGRDMWTTKAVERLGIPSLMMTDGPNGLRKQVGGGDHLGLNASVPATCFPTAAAMGASFDRALMREVGAAIGEECQAENVAVVLGPGVNIKRSPLCGRNFEYFSEDPFLSGQMGASHIRGVQSQGVGTSLKHFAVNNQETRRMTVDAEIDERTLREIYLPAFETAVREGNPATVMCAYNKINGVYCCENPKTLTHILREEWGYHGCVVTDWGAMDDRVESVKAGLELQMPGGDPLTDQKLVEAVRDGTLEEATLDRAVARILRLVLQLADAHKPNAAYDIAAHDALARRAAGEGLVLLKNEGDILPLRAGQRVAFLGAFAAEPRFQGGGSSHIHPHKITSALEAAGEWGEIAYARGYDLKGENDEALAREAVALAAASEVAVLFAGMPDVLESEGFDRRDLRLPANQCALIEAVAAVQPNLVVVLANASALEMPWLQRVKGLIEGYLGGQAVGGAVADVLFGRVNPSGRLAETFPLKLSDNPSYLNFPGDGDKVRYAEGVYVGYRYYDKKEMDVLFPFGYGLSYTRFAYANLRLDKTEMDDTETLTVRVDVTNTGARAGKEVVALYVAPRCAGVARPIRELKGFEKLALEPGETKTAVFTLAKRAFAYYEETLRDWYVQTGAYAIEIGRSSRDIVLSQEVAVRSTTRVPVHYTLNTTLADVDANPIGHAFVTKMVQAFAGFNQDADTPVMGMDGAALMRMMGSMPLRSLLGFVANEEAAAAVRQMLEQMNNG